MNAKQILILVIFFMFVYNMVVFVIGSHYDDQYSTCWRIYKSTKEIHPTDNKVPPTWEVADACGREKYETFRDKHWITKLLLR